MNILVIRFTSMGDVILVTSLFSYLKQRYPDGKIFFLTDALYAGLFKDDTRIFQVAGLEKNASGSLPESLSGVVWDQIIDVQNNARSAAIRKSLAPCRVTGVLKKRHADRFFLLFGRVNRYPAGDHVALRYIHAASEGDSSPARRAPPLALPLREEESMAVYRSFFSNGVVRPTIALAPFSAWKNKEWPRRKFIDVGQYFHAKGWNVAIVGGPDDSAAAQLLQEGIGIRCRALAGQLSLYENACFLKQCALMLGNDTGLSHLARACGVKTGVIFGSTTFHFGFFPFGSPPYKVFQANIGCRPCHPHGGNFCWLATRSCLNRISPETVIKGLEQLRISTVETSPER